MNKNIILQKVIDKINAKVYVEVGVEKGINFFSINAPVKIAIDPKFRFGKRHKIYHPKDWFRSRYFQKSSNAFFAEDAPTFLSKRTIDVAFIDGLHTYAQSLLDFQNCLNYLSPNGIILLHDCNPVTREAAAPVESPAEMYAKFPQRLNNNWNGDVWKTILKIRSMKDFEVFVLDCDQGIGVVRRKTAEPDKDLIELDITSLNYEDFDQNRYYYLNLKSPDYLDLFLASLS